MTLRRRSPMKRGGRVKAINKARRTSEFARTYGSKARVAWVKALPCAVDGCRETPSENAHVVGGGAGRKADANTIVPLCAVHHRLQHRYGWGRLDAVWLSEDWRLARAAEIQTRWERYAEED